MTTPLVANVFPGASTWEFQRQWEDGWYPYVPSIAEGPAGHAALLSTNNVQRPKGATPQPDDWLTAHVHGGNIYTRNFFSLLDDDLHPLGWVEQPQPNLPVVYHRVQGIGEPRLCWRDGDWRWAGMTCQHHESGTANVVAGTIGSADVELVYGAHDGWRKNPMPSKIGIVDLYHQTNPPQHGSGVTPYGDGFLGVVHWYQNFHVHGMFSEHRFALIDGDGMLERLSGPFRFSEWPLDIVGGVAFHRGDVILSYSRQDRETYLARIPLDEVLAWFEATA